MSETIRQGATLIATKDFGFKVGGKGRAVRVRTGQRFWATNSTLDQTKAGLVTIAREGRGVISHGWAFPLATVGGFFEVAA